MSKKKTVDELHRDIEGYDKMLSKHPERDNTHSLKARALFQLGELTSNKEYYGQALSSYDKAIKLKPDNSNYVIERSKVHAALGDVSAATKDVIEAQKLPSMGGIHDLYTRNTTKDVLKLDKMQDEVSNLIKTGQIPKELEAKFAEIIISVKGNKDGKPDEKLMQKLQQIEQDYLKLTILAPIISQLKQEIMTSVNNDIRKLDQRVTNLEVAHQAFDKLRKKLEETANVQAKDKEIILNKIWAIEKRLEGVADRKEVELITAKLIEMGEEAEFNKDKLSDLEKQVEGLEYHQGKTDERLQQLELTQQKFEEVKKRLDENNTIQVRDKQEIVSKINNIENKLKGLVNKDDIELITAEVAKLINEGKFTKGRLADLEEQVDGMAEQQSKMQERLQQLELAHHQFESIKQKLGDNNAIKQVDIDAMVSKIDSIEQKLKGLENKQDLETITTAINNLISESKFTKGRIGDIEDQLDGLLDQQGSKTEVIVNMVSNITYDNLLLNHPELLSESAKLFGMDRAIDLSELLPPELIGEAIESHDATLVLAGMMSVNSNFGV